MMRRLMPEACKAALDEVKAAEPARLVARLLDEPGSSASPIAAAEEALTDATNLLQQARQVRDLLEQRETDAKAEIERAGYALQNALGEALATAPEIFVLLSEYRERQRRVAELEQCLRADSYSDSRWCSRDPAWPEPHTLIATSRDPAYGGRESPIPN